MSTVLRERHRYFSRNVQFYELISSDPSPVTLDEAKDYLKITVDADDDLIQALIDACTEWGEKYTARDFRVNQWKLSIDIFETVIKLFRSPINTIDSVEYFNDEETPVETTVSADVYYQKKLTQHTEIHLQIDQEWPEDVLEQEQQIAITFSTQPVASIESIKKAILRHVMYMYENRGDCGTDCAGCADPAGVTVIYNLYRIARI